MQINPEPPPPQAEPDPWADEVEKAIVALQREVERLALLACKQGSFIKTLMAERVERQRQRGTRR
jgi:hypothetical protein